MQEMLGEDYDGKMVDILKKCTEFDPKKRYQNVSDLKEALRKEPWSLLKKIGVGLGGAAILTCIAPSLSSGNTGVLGKIILDDDDI